MNKKLFSRLGLMIVMGLTMVNCSQNDELLEPTYNMDNNGTYHYTMDLTCDVPIYDDGNTTRGITNSWANGAQLYIRFKSGSSYVSGTATYRTSSSDWDVEASSTLSTISGEANCEVYYFANPETANSTTVKMTEHTACYCTYTATYTHPSTSSISIKATLDKKTWRLRFKGTSGTKITLPAEENDLLYYSSFSPSKGTFADPVQKDVDLTVGSDGYTPYIYATFAKTSGNNTIALVVNNDKKGFKRSFNASKLSVGESAFLTIPLQASNEWTEFEVIRIDPNAIIQTEDMVTFTDGFVTTWTLGSTVNTFDYMVFTKSGAEALTDDQLANEIYGSDPYTLENADYIFKATSSELFIANTEYYLCAVAKNSSGQRGPVLRQLFKTNPDNLPSAEISNITAASTTKWTYDITLKNNAKSYYLATSIEEDDYNSDWHWLAYYAYIWGSTGQLEAHDWPSVATTLRSGTCNLITVCTWGLDANNKIGNPYVAYGSASSSSRSLSPVNPSPQKDMISKKQMQEIRNNTVIYMINK